MKTLKYEIEAGVLDTINQRDKTFRKRNAK